MQGTKRITAAGQTVVMPDFIEIRNPKDDDMDNKDTPYVVKTQTENQGGETAQ